MPCPVCNSHKYDVIFAHARIANIRKTYESKESTRRLIIRLNTSLCTNCGMLYRTPLMSDADQKLYYEKDYLEKYKGYPKEQESNDEPTLRKKRQCQPFFNFLSKNKISFKAKKVLDIGCGDALFLALINRFSPRFRLGIEPSKEHCEIHKNRKKNFNKNKEFDFEVSNGCIRDFSTEEIGKFDLITMTGVLEHLSNPLSDLKVIRSLMTDDSYLYMYTHNETPSLITDINKRISLVHQLYFTPKTIRILLRKIGFQIISIKIRDTNMHILAKKWKHVNNLSYNLNRIQFFLLKVKYLVFKNIPSNFFSFTMCFYQNWLGVLHRLNLTKIY